MNCKPGDLAIVTWPEPEGEQYLGMMVEVLYAQPAHRFQLPNGQWHEEATRPNCWVLRILGPQRRAPLLEGGTRLTSYGCGRDSALKPLGGLPVDETIDQEITA